MGDGYLSRTVWLAHARGRPRVTHRISEILLMYSLGFYFLLSYSGLAMKALGILLMGICQGRCGWLMHVKERPVESESHAKEEPVICFVLNTEFSVVGLEVFRFWRCGSTLSTISFFFG